MARTPTFPPDDPRMWRRLVARTHPDAGGDHELFIWTGAVRDTVLGLSLCPGVSPEPDVHPARRREGSTEEPARVPFDPGADFAALTGRALERGGEFAPMLALLRDCWPAEHLAHEQGRGASYKRLAAIGHAWSMTKAERTASEAIRENDPEKLDSLLQRAERSGDAHLADAVYHVSTERGLRGVAASYLEKRPAERKRWEEYAEARGEADASADPLSRFLASGDHGPVRPAELGGVGAGAA